MIRFTWTEQINALTKEEPSKCSCSKGQKIIVKHTNKTFHTIDFDNIKVLTNKGHLKKTNRPRSHRHRKIPNHLTTMDDRYRLPTT